MKRIALTFAAIVGLSVAHAQFFTGNEIYNYQTGSSNQKMIALGYVQGVYDSLLGIAFCPPANVTAGQVHDMTRQVLENNPALRNRPADQFVKYVLRDTWPCEKRGREGASL